MHHANALHLVGSIQHHLLLFSLLPFPTPEQNLLPRERREVVLLDESAKLTELLVEI